MDKRTGLRYAFRIAVGITMLVLLLAGGADATNIRNDVTGGDCLSIGTWNAGTKTCTLTKDLTEEVTIESSGIILDGNGHTITGHYGINGVNIYGKTNVIIKNLNVNNFQFGIILKSSNNNIVSGNNFSNNRRGIVLGSSSNNILSDNIVNSNSKLGISMDSSSNNNTLIRNKISWNFQYGIYLYYSSNNHIYNNYFNNNDNEQFYSITIMNTTRTPGTNIIGGSYLGGNFWANPSGTGFSQTCADVDRDGICDSPYVLDANYLLDTNNIDYLPLALDLSEPATTIDFIGTIGNNNWYNSDVEVTLTATDNEGGSGVAKTEYSLDNGINWIQYNEPFTISTEGTTTILYKSTDKAGNIEEQKTQTVKIDKNPPDITGNAINPPNDKGWYNTGVTVRFNCEDTVSEPIESFFDVFVNSEGNEQSANGVCSDNAGNDASLVVSDINIDKTSPEITIDIPTEGSEYTLNQVLLADWSAEDLISGLASSTGTKTNGEAIDTDTVGAKTFIVNAEDNAGNTNSETNTYYVYKKLPNQKIVIDDSDNKVMFQNFDIGNNWNINLRDASTNALAYQFSGTIGEGDTKLRGNDWNVWFSCVSQGDLNHGTLRHIAPGTYTVNADGTNIYGKLISSSPSAITVLASDDKGVNSGLIFPIFSGIIFPS